MGELDIYVQILAWEFEHALGHMRSALTDCPEQLWEAALWPDAPVGLLPNGGLGGSAPWLLAHHALTILDYDLTGGFEPWEPPPPFDEHIEGEANRVFTKAELLSYVEWCRDRVCQTLETLTEEKAARPLPEAHRYRGTPYGVIAAGMMPMHVLEHAEQIRQFLAAAGVKPS